MDKSKQTLAVNDDDDRITTGGSKSMSNLNGRQQ